jgi:hypothetical protein
MTEEQWTRIQQIIKEFRPGGITAENYEALPPDPVSRPPEPTTARQINYLKVLGFKGPTIDLSKQEACELIARLARGPR